MGVSAGASQHDRIGVSSSHSGVPEDCNRRERNTAAEVVACDAHIDNDCASVSSEAESQEEGKNAGERDDASTQASLGGAAAACRFCRLLERVAASDE